MDRLKRFCLGLTLLIPLAVTILTLVFVQVSSGLQRQTLEDRAERLHRMLDGALAEAETEALARADLVAQLPGVVDALARRDRLGLRAAVSATYERQKTEYGVIGAQFHIPPATSFLRLQEPTRFGDDLSVFRPMIAIANNDCKRMTGLAMTRGGPAIVGVVPVISPQGAHVGTFEINFSFDRVLTQLNRRFGLSGILFADEVMLRAYAKSMDKGLLTRASDWGAHVQLASRGMIPLVSLLQPADLAQDAPQTRILHADGGTYALLLQPIADASGARIGVIALAEDLSALDGAAHRALLLTVLAAVAVGLGLAGAAWAVLTRRLLRPLRIQQQRFAVLLAGNPLPPRPAPAGDAIWSTFAQVERALHPAPGQDDRAKPGLPRLPPPNPDA